MIDILWYTYFIHTAFWFWENGREIQDHRKSSPWMSRSVWHTHSQACCELFNSSESFVLFIHKFMTLKAKMRLSLFYKNRPRLTCVFSFAVFWMLGFLIEKMENEAQPLTCPPSSPDLTTHFIISGYVQKHCLLRVNSRSCSGSCSEHVSLYLDHFDVRKSWKYFEYGDIF
jgi:hypothetical protein